MCASTLGGACDSTEPPENPTWADVEPILRAECGHCHGAGANTTGGGVRFDFYDLASPNPCGEAATVLDVMGSARAQSNSIAMAITTSDPNVRPIMPPIPAPYLTDNQWLTILRWTANPLKGDKPPNNLPPRIRLDVTATASQDTLDVFVTVDDPEGEPVVGVVKVGDRIGNMDRSGAFSARYDTTSWPAGTVTVTAVICDGWSQVSAPLRTVEITH